MQKECFKTRPFRDDYYLYAVMNAPNYPAENLGPEEKVEVVRYVVLSEEIRPKGKKRP